MNTILVLYPEAFNCQSKLTRKLSNITRNMREFNLVSFHDDGQLIKTFAEELNVRMSLVEGESLDSLAFTHAVVFDDGEEFESEIKAIQARNLPLRMINTPITRVINVKNNPEFNESESTEHYEYIGRGSYWGNPHSMFETFEESDEDPREAVIRMYKYDFDYDKFLNIDKSKVYELAGKRLGCFCKPQSCHGDVLADYLNQWDDGK